ncbi:lysozyme inhibitor LprI family protein [Cronobacter malonaticus]|uniref:lysozyme inhibitor LprI family protein n=1 Tax=Cronobacter malonaticus TaxID=413503 RepID=UPI0029C9E0F0|nr:lysozyme inhibitor LprI family protein [Cronobacter malonaticus]
MLREIVLSVIIVFSGAADAGLFDLNDFKCGRDDAVKALAKYIKDDASGMLQSDSLTKAKFNYDKPISAYQNMLNTMEVLVTNVSTSREESYGLSCIATISIQIPKDTLEVVSKVPSYLSYVTGAYGKINNNGVIWSDVNYTAKLADNNKDILFSDFNKTDASTSLFNMSVLAVNKEQIINTLSQRSLSSAQSAYVSADTELNAVWKELPESARKAMKKEQLAWVNSKVAKCGKLSDSSSETINIQQRINIYQCQTKMTYERISYLTGNDD